MIKYCLFLLTGPPGGQFDAPKAGMMPPVSNNPMYNQGPPPRGIGPPQANQGPPQAQKYNVTSPRPPGQPHGAPARPPGHFGVGPFQPTSATPPPQGSVLPGTIPRSSSIPNNMTPAGQMYTAAGQPMVNGLPHGQGSPRPPYPQVLFYLF
jgi:hypothetical protein